MRILGNVLSKNKTIYSALQTIYGIGKSRALFLLKSINIPINKKVFSMNIDEENLIRNFIDNNFLPLEGALKILENKRILRLNYINCYRAKRRFSGLPLRGQRTRTNAKTTKKLKKLTN